MKIIERVPFYENTPDDTHCLQACLKMVLKYYFTEEEYSWDELDKFTGKKDGMWTWTMDGLMWLKNKGLEVRNIEIFDYDKFSKEGEGYFRKEFGNEVADAQNQHGNVDEESKKAIKFINLVDTIKNIPELEDIKKMLNEKYLIMTKVNAMALDKEEGYAGHLVLIKGYDNDALILNDPGLPGVENRKVDFRTFEKAWAYPNEKAKNIMAFRKRL